MKGFLRCGLFCAHTRKVPGNRGGWSPQVYLMILYLLICLEGLQPGWGQKSLKQSHGLGKSSGFCHLTPSMPCRYGRRERGPAEHRVPQSADLLPEARPHVWGNCLPIPQCPSFLCLEIREQGCGTQAVTWGPSSVLCLILSCWVLKFMMIFQQGSHIFFLQWTLQVL